MDPQIKNFEGRLRRIDKIHRKGGGFEAAGTLGQSYYTALKRRTRRSSVRPVVMLVAGLLVGKALLMASHGDAGYDARLVHLHKGGTIEQVGAFVMARDPISSQIAAWLEPLIGTSTG